MELGALLEKPAVILCHRGVMDASAYTTEETWQIILDEQGWNTVNLRDRRYDAVLHLVSAADGAVEYFLKRNKHATDEVIAIRISPCFLIIICLNFLPGNKNCCSD